MRDEFWHKVWENDTIGFHQDQVHPLLRKHFGAQSTSATAPYQILVPLCGKSKDMLWLTQYGKVTGAELSDIACRDFFVEHQIDYNVKHAFDHYQYYQSEKIDLWQGDFFKLPEAATPKPFDWIYDRAALIALPSPLRQTYANKLTQYISDHTQLLLCSLEFPEQELVGPPFPVFADEIARLFTGFDIQLIESQPLANNRFARRTFNVSSLVETLYLIKPL